LKLLAELARPNRGAAFPASAFRLEFNMFGKTTALALALFLTAELTSVTLAADQAVKPTGTWSGKIKDELPRKLAPKSGVIANAKTWKKLWTAWQPNADLPKTNFGKELILVGTVPGPNAIDMPPTKDDSGNVRFTVSGTEMAGPGFGYKLIRISRIGVKTINGKAVPRKDHRSDGQVIG
jgi:hypothetical protein